MDWAEMLERMYSRWAHSQGYQVTVLDRSRGEEAGVKSVEIQIEGRLVYGYLKGKVGWRHSYVLTIRWLDLDFEMACKSPAALDKWWLYWTTNVPTNGVTY
jgi:hypothetical protein